MSVIKVNFDVYSTKWHIDKSLKELSKYSLLGFDTETKGLYSKQERIEATEYLKDSNLPVDSRSLALQVASNNGLSFPSLVSVTHFVFGTSENSSVILICSNPQLELHIWNWIANCDTKFIVHNALFDLKIMYARIGKFPKDYEDSQILAKCLTNNVEVYKALVGLKDLMGSYYDPMWVLVNEYEPDNLKDPKFLQYAGIDGAATVKLWYDIQDHIGK